ncbi:hypothetical protein D3C81_1687710 [compost metagenome]
MPVPVHCSTILVAACLLAIPRRLQARDGLTADRLYAGSDEITARCRPGAETAVGRRFASWQSNNRVLPQSGGLPPTPPRTSPRSQSSEKDAALDFATAPDGAAARASGIQYGSVPAFPLEPDQ